MNVTGELIGLEYLFRQTGRAIPDMEDVDESSEQPEEDDELEEDEGFEETFPSEIEDPTISHLINSAGMVVKELNDMPLKSMFEYT